MARPEESTIIWYKIGPRSLLTLAIVAGYPGKNIRGLHRLLSEEGVKYEPLPRLIAKCSVDLMEDDIRYLANKEWVQRDIVPKKGGVYEASVTITPEGLATLVEQTSVLQNLVTFMVDMRHKQF